MGKDEYIPCLECKNRMVAEGHLPYCSETGLTLETREQMLNASGSCRTSVSLYARRRQDVPLTSQLQTT